MNGDAAIAVPAEPTSLHRAVTATGRRRQLGADGDWAVTATDAAGTGGKREEAIQIIRLLMAAGADPHPTFSPFK